MADAPAALDSFNDRPLEGVRRELVAVGVKKEATVAAFAKKWGMTVVELNALNGLNLEPGVKLAVGSELYVMKRKVGRLWDGPRVHGDVLGADLRALLQSPAAPNPPPPPDPREHPDGQADEEG